MRIPLAVVLPEKIRMHVLAQARDLRFHLRLRAVADADHGDDRADADDDAERGQRRAQLVAPQRAQRDPESREEPHRRARLFDAHTAAVRASLAVIFASSCRRDQPARAPAMSLTTRPSRMTMIAPRVAGDVRLVRDHDDGDALVVQLLENVHDLDARAAIEIARRLVGEQHVGIVDEGARDGDALLLAAGKLAG